MLAPFLLLLTVGTDLTYVRHAETVANATGRYNTRTLNTFTAKGDRQVATLTEALLKERPWDVILVSPSPRALKTIAPYLAKSGRRATVWPLLYECCTERPRQPEAARFGWGAPVEIPKEIAAHFVVPEGAKLPAPRNYGEGLAQVSATVREFAAFRGKRILLVGHSAHGGQFLRRLNGKAYHIQNAEPIHLRLP
jgi:broad specificity phosphatase PhoE